MASAPTDTTKPWLDRKRYHNHFNYSRIEWSSAMVCDAMASRELSHHLHLSQLERCVTRLWVASRRIRDQYRPVIITKWISTLVSRPTTAICFSSQPWIIWKNMHIFGLNTLCAWLVRHVLPLIQTFEMEVITFHTTLTDWNNDLLDSITVNRIPNIVVDEVMYEAPLRGLSACKPWSKGWRND